MLDAAERLRGRDDVRFLFVGAGAAREGLIAAAKERELANVLFHPAQPKETMGALWSLCDAALVHLENNPLFATVIPSKLFEAMGMGVPTVLAAPAGEASAIVRRTHCGVHVPARDPASLAETIEFLAGDRQFTAELGQAAAAAAPRYDRAALAREMLDALENVAAGRPPRATADAAPQDVATALDTPAGALPAPAEDPAEERRLAS